MNREGEVNRESEREEIEDNARMQCNCCPWLNEGARNESKTKAKQSETSGTTTNWKTNK